MGTSVKSDFLEFSALRESASTLRKRAYDADKRLFAPKPNSSEIRRKPESAAGAGGVEWGGKERRRGGRSPRGAWESALEPSG